MSCNATKARYGVFLYGGGVNIPEKYEPSHSPQEWCRTLQGRRVSWEHMSGWWTISNKARVGIGPTRPTHFINRVQLPANDTILFNIIITEKWPKLTTCSRIYAVSVLRSFCVPVFCSVKIKAIRTHLSRQCPRRMSSPISNRHPRHVTRIGIRRTSDS